MRTTVLVSLIFIVLTAAGTGLAPLLAQDDFQEVSKSERKNALSTVKPDIESDAYKGLALSLQQGSVLVTILLLIAGNVIFFVRRHRLRYVSLLISLALLGFYQGGCACSVGATVKIFVNIITDHHALAAALLLGIPIAATLVSGRIFCGHVCPLGAVQEFLTIKEKSPVSVPLPLEKKLRWLRWVMFVGLVGASLGISHYIFEDIDPYRAIFELKGNALQWVLAAILLIVGLFITRPFCRFLCPLAVWLKIAAKFSFFKIKKDAVTCTSCTLCKKNCPVNAIDDSCIIDESECIRCGRCIDACPKGSLCGGTHE